MVSKAAIALRKYRSDLGLSQTAMGLLVSRSQQAISHYETGRLRPDLGVAHDVEAVTDGSVKAREWLEAAEASECPLAAVEQHSDDRTNPASDLSQHSPASALQRAR